MTIEKPPAASMRGDDPVLGIEGLQVDVRTPERGWRRVVRDFDLELQAGEITALVGESGSGKTMIGRAILGLLPPVAEVRGGDIRFGDTALVGAGEAQLRRLRGREIGMVFQEPMVSLNPALRVGAQMTEALRLHHGVSAGQARSQCLAMLERVRISDPVACFNAWPHQFSGGMRQRIMLASVLVMRPRLLIADEPTTALDAIVQKEVMDIMVSLSRDTSTAILLVSHDLSMVAHYADNVIVLRKGETIESGRCTDILLSPQHEYTRTLLGALPSRTTTAAPPSADARPLVEVQSLRVEFTRKAVLFWRKPTIVRAVEDADFSIREHETLAVVGESGSGKTTIGRALMRLTETQAGTIRFDAEEITGLDGAALKRHRSRAQMVFQDPYSSLDPRMNLGDIVAEGLRNLPGLSKVERKQRACEMLAEVGLPGDYADRHPHELSGGQRQRVCIARAIVSRPRFVVADEPVSALDVTIQKQVLDLLETLQTRFGFTCLFISHDLGVVEQIADRVLVMYRGRILESGSRDDIYDRPLHPYTRRLLQATPRIMRTESGGYRLHEHEALPREAPPGYRHYNHGSIPGVPLTPEPPLMIENSPGHLVACVPT
ncbi:MAG TPA: ABC transporter ATP-binding protein [Rhodocyclaceae bacterium]|nr:ABC transporter ATP-binding protein [Rhodocyclaceae bacterium]